MAPFPTPGKPFWAGMPGRVYRAVQQQEKKRPRLDLHELLQHLVLPRWAWTVAVAAIVLVFSWVIVNPLQRQDTAPVASGDEYSYDDVSSHDPVLRHTSTTIAELTSSQLDAVDAWAGAELSSLANEAGANTTNIFDTDLNEELAELNVHEVDRLSTMLKELDEEG